MPKWYRIRSWARNKRLQFVLQMLVAVAPGGIVAVILYHLLRRDYAKTSTAPTAEYISLEHDEQETEAGTASQNEQKEGLKIHN